MKDGKPVDFSECPHATPKRHSCKCGRCLVCGFQKHSSIHGGIMDLKTGAFLPGKVFGHEFEPYTRDRLRQPAQPSAEKAGE